MIPVFVKGSSRRRLILLASAFWLATAAALGPPDTVTAAVVRYDASSATLPNQLCPAWQPFINGGPPAPTFVAGRLRIATTANAQELAYGHGGTDLQIPGTLVVEFRARWITGTAPHPAMTGTGVIIGVGGNVGVHFSIDHDSIYLSKIGSGGALERGWLASVDTDGAMHTYRIEITGTAINVRQDGVLVLTGATSSSATFWGGTPQIFWGDFTSTGSGTSDWEYFEHNAYVVPQVPGFFVETHALVDGAGTLSLAPDGTLFTGHDVPGEQTRIFRVGACAPSTLFGPVLPDPDAVLFDPTGLVGSPGTVLVGSQLVGSGTGRIDAVQADGSFTIVVGPTSILLNPSDMTFDSQGRLLVALEDGRVVAHFAGTTSVLFTIPGGQVSSIAVAPDGSILTTAAHAGPSIQIHRHAADGSVLASPFLTGLASGAPVAFGPGGPDWGMDLYTVRADGALLRVTLEGAVSVIGSGFSGRANDIGFGPDGAMYASAYQECRVLRIARQSLATTPPTIAAPPAISLAADPGACGRAVPTAALGTATASDYCGSVTTTHDAPGFFPVGATSVTWTATDGDGYSATAIQILTITDSEPPALTLPADVAATTGPGTQACADVRLALEIGDAIATDNCGTATISVSGLPAGSLFPVGETLLTWAATDAAGNSVTGTQLITVSCPVGELAGSALLACNGQSDPAGNVTVRLLHEGAPFRATTTGPAGEFRFDQVRLGTYTVVIEPPAGFGIPVDYQIVTLAGSELAIEPFVFTCLLADLTGQVEGSCDGQTSGLLGITVDLYRDGGAGMDVLVATTATDASGGFRFDDLALGEYTVSFVLPLSYTTGSSSQSVTLAVADATVIAQTFGLTCRVIAAQPRSMGYWKHQVNVYLTGKGSAQETLADLLHYVDGLLEHFNENLVNPVVVYVPGATTTNDKLLQLQQLLTVNRGGTALDRTKQQLLALLLNVVSGKISQTEVISDDGATVSQAITHSHDLMIDVIPGNDETAKTICDLINNGQTVPAGMVPVSTRSITYDRQPERPGPGKITELWLGPIAPNPAISEATVTFALTSATPAVLEVHDLAGRLIARREVGTRGEGVHTIRLGELAHVRAGVYMVRLVQDGMVRSLRLAVVR